MTSEEVKRLANLLAICYADFAEDSCVGMDAAHALDKVDRVRLELYAAIDELATGRKPHCKECAEYTRVNAETEQWAADVRKGRAIVEAIVKKLLEKRNVIC